MRDAARPVPIVRPLRYCSLVCLNFMGNKRSALCLCGWRNGCSAGFGWAQRGRSAGRSAGLGDGRRVIDPAKGKRCGRQVQLRPGAELPYGGRQAASAGCPWVKIAAKQIPFALFLRRASSLQRPAALQPCAKEGPFPAELPSR